MTGWEREGTIQLVRYLEGPNTKFRSEQRLEHLEAACSIIFHDESMTGFLYSEYLFRHLLQKLIIYIQIFELKHELEVWLWP